MMQEIQKHESSLQCKSSRFYAGDLTKHFYYYYSAIQTDTNGDGTLMDDIYNRSSSWSRFSGLVTFTGDYRRNRRGPYQVLGEWNNSNKWRQNKTDLYSRCYCFKQISVSNGRRVKILLV